MVDVPDEQSRERRAELEGSLRVVCAARRVQRSPTREVAPQLQTSPKATRLPGDPASCSCTVKEDPGRAK